MIRNTAGGFADPLKAVFLSPFPDIKASLPQPALPCQLYVLICGYSVKSSASRDILCPTDRVYHRSRPGSLMASGEPWKTLPDAHRVVKFASFVVARPSGRFLRSMQISGLF